ncbi:MAG TPA: PhnD/SsuA/transferrin family substrate-binding protein [Thermodesulfovibrionales bacterium]|nr:PhnD/SsuA/transferrin family substrate-binding protein [Thermodesulfovibrionales bacterium]
MKLSRIVCVIVTFLLLGINGRIAQADQLNLAIMEDMRGAVKKYAPLIEYLNNKGIQVSLIEVPTYPIAAKTFASGKIDAMFSGSGIAGTMMIKGVANPLVRPLSKEGISTYSAIILAPKGSPKFTGSADYFTGKNVIFTSLASAGEFYFYSIPNIASVNAIKLPVPSHGYGIEALAHGGGQIAIVKNRVWDKMKDKYPHLEAVGEGKGEYPDNTLIVSSKTNKETIAKLARALLTLKDDNSPQTQSVRDQMDIQGYIKTTTGDFKDTFEILKKGGVDQSFNFAFK